MANVKDPTTYDQQLEILKSRGVEVNDEVFCKEKLMEINYYRITAYLLPFKNSDDTYKEGTSFHTAYRIYEFDRKLRRILFSAIEEVEISLRTRLAYYHAHKYSALGYWNAECFSNKHDSKKFEDNIKREIKNNKKNLIVQHHEEVYDGNFPIWVIVEFFTFGMLSIFYNDMIRKDKKKLAKELYDTIPEKLDSWLRCVTDLRNICAHYGRLYYRIFPSMPRGFDIEEFQKRRLWGAVLSLKSLYPNRDKWNHEVLENLKSLFEEYRGYIDLYHLAFPEDWEYQLKK